MPTISVITINYNNLAGLKETVASVINQVEADFEYLLIDGGSSDGSKEFIQQNQHKFSYWVSEKDAGIYAAMNKGIDRAKGEYCLFLNSGDVLVDKGILNKVISLHRTESILYGELIFDFGGGKEKLAKLPKHLNLLHLYTDNIWHPASFIKRNLLLNFGKYNETFSIAADYEFFFYTLGIQKESSYYLDFPISKYASDGISSLPENADRVMNERSRVHQKYLNRQQLKLLENWKKYKSEAVANWISKRYFLNSVLDKLLAIYHKFRNKKW